MIASLAYIINTPYSMADSHVNSCFHFIWMKSEHFRESQLVNETSLCLHCTYKSGSHPLAHGHLPFPQWYWQSWLIHLQPMGATLHNSRDTIHIATCVVLSALSFLFASRSATQTHSHSPHAALLSPYRISPWPLTLHPHQVPILHIYCGKTYLLSHYGLVSYLL